MFKSTKMRNAIKNYIADATGEGYKYPHYDEVPLLAYNSTTRVKEDSIHAFVRKSTLNGLGEGDYFKSAVSEIKEVRDFKKLKMMSKNRGTQIDTIVSSYHLDFESG
jgi:hypothetical protein